MTWKKPNYKKAYLILEAYFDELPEDDKPHIDRALKECGL